MAIFFLSFASLYVQFIFCIFHSQEPKIPSYRQKGSIPTPITRRNPCYRNGDHTRSIPQDPWFSFFNFNFVHFMPYFLKFLLKYSLDPVYFLTCFAGILISYSCLQVIGSETLTFVCRGVLHISLPSLFSLLFFTFHFSVQSFHKQEPTLLSYK